MTNIEKIIFDSKYSLKYMNGKYVLSGFNHVKSLHIDVKDIYKILDTESLVYFDEEEWEEFINKNK